METKLIKIKDSNDIQDAELLEAAQILRDGGLVAFPTETVYGPVSYTHLGESHQRNPVLYPAVERGGG